MSVFVSLVVSMLWKVYKQSVPNLLNTGSAPLCAKLFQALGSI